jgi:CheY-like chemotaxis protein
VSYCSVQTYPALCSHPSAKIRRDETREQNLGECYYLGAVTAPGFSYRILIVDDDLIILQVSSLVFTDQGYEVRTAADGFQALVELRRSLPDVIVSDLRMPGMSGFELLSVVRRRFPHIPVIAISAEFGPESSAGLIADAFFAKGHYSSEELIHKIAELIKQAPLRPQMGKRDTAPVWIPRNDTGYFVVTCTDCLRSFSVPDDELPTWSSEIRSAICTFCGVTVRYLADVSTPQKKKPTPSQ